MMPGKTIRNDTKPHLHPEGDPIVELSQAPLPFVLLSCVFGGLLVAAAAVGGKIIDIFGLTPSATVLAYSLTFLCTDVVSEVYGKPRAKQLVWGGFVTILFSLVLFQLAIHWKPASFWDNQDAYSSVLGSSTRIILGGVVAYIVSQVHDVWAFHFWRRVTGGKHLWLRNNLSTMSSQLIDTAIFISIAFYGLFPIGTIIVGHYVIKLLIAAIDTPIAYLLVRQIRKTAAPSL